jgi:DNA-binding MarR family transcriptional regulator
MKKINSELAARETGPAHPSLSAYLGYCLYKSAMKHRAAINAALSKYDIIAPQLGILCILHSDGPTSQVDLGNIMSVDKATMVKLIDGVEQRGWIKREGQSEDRRVKKVCITKTGEKIFKELLKIRAEVEKEFLSVLSKEEEKILRNIIPKLLRSPQ